MKRVTTAKQERDYSYALEERRMRRGLTKRQFALAMLAFNLFGDGMRDALDPKMRR